MTQPLTDAINALTRYANEITGQSDPDLSSAVRTLCDGYGQGDGDNHWVRPSDFPDYSKLDISSEEALYLTYDTRMEPSFALLKINNIAYRVEIGTLSNGIFTVIDSDEIAKNDSYFKLLERYETNYVVLKVTANEGQMTSVTLTNYGNYTFEGVKYHSNCQSLIEVYGRLPNLKNLDLLLRNARNTKSVTLFDMGSVTNLERFAGDAILLENVDISGLPTTGNAGLYYAFTNCRKLKYLYLHGARINSMVCTFQECFCLEFTDLEQLNVRTTGSVQGMFNNCRGLRGTLDLSNWEVTTNMWGSAFMNTSGLEKLILSTGWQIRGNITSIFNSSGISEVPQADYGVITNINSFFQGSFIYGTLDLRNFDFDTITQLTGLAYMPHVNSIIVPDNFTSVGNGAMRDDYNLQEIHFLATTPPTLANKDAITWNDCSLTHIYVPYSADHSVLQAYQTANIWSQLTDYLVEEPNE